MHSSVGLVEKSTAERNWYSPIIVPLKSLYCKASFLVLSGLLLACIAKPEVLNATEVANLPQFPNYPQANIDEGGLDTVLHLGINADGLNIAVLDSGIHPELFRQLNIVDVQSMVSDGQGGVLPEDAYDRTHGSIVASVLQSYLQGSAHEFKGANILARYTCPAGCDINATVAAIKDILQNHPDTKIIQITVAAFDTGNQEICRVINSAPKDVVFVVSVGNDGLPFRQFVNGQNYFADPAGCESDRIIAVGAFEIGENKYIAAAYSNDNGLENDIYGIKVSGPGGAFFVNIDKDGNFVEGHASGTSIATPYITALVAMLKKINPSMTADQIEEMLSKTGFCPDPKTILKNIGCRPIPINVFRADGSIYQIAMPVIKR